MLSYRPHPRPGVLRVERTIQPLNGVLTYVTPKTKGSRRRVPLTAATSALLRDYLAAGSTGAHPHASDPSAPLFPGMRLDPPQTADLAALSVERRPRRGSCSTGQRRCGT